MTREEKAAVVAALQERFAKATVTFVATNKGLSVEHANRLRRALGAVAGEYKVAKHTLTRRALEETERRTLEGFLQGPRGLVFGYGDPIAVAKVLVEFAAQNNKLQIDGGTLEGQLLVAEQVKTLAAMPPLDALRGRLAQQALAPGAGLVSAVAGVAGRLVAALAALADRLEGAGAQQEPGPA